MKTTPQGQKLIKRLKKRLDKTIHKIGLCGAVGFVTPDGSVCAECGKKIKD